MRGRAGIPLPLPCYGQERVVVVVWGVGVWGVGGGLPGLIGVHVPNSSHSGTDTDTDTE